MSKISFQHYLFLVMTMLSIFSRPTTSLHPFKRHTTAFLSSMCNATTTTKFDPMELTARPPQCNLVPPGVCQFTPQFQSVPLLGRIPVGEGGTSFILRFGLPDGEKSMGLTTCACILACAELEDRETGEKSAVIRPYTVSITSYP